MPCFSVDKVRFGTNTSCVEVKWGEDKRLLFDAGTGIIGYGNAIEEERTLGNEPLHLFLSHFHWDHIHGLPFFKPVYDKKSHLIIHGLPGVEAVFSGQLMDPFSPIPLNALAAHIEYVKRSNSIEVNGASVRPFKLNHPQGCYGYVFEVEGRKIVYATDTEPDGGEMDALLLKMVEGADCLIMDSNNSLAEDKKRNGWGHSTWRDCANTAKKASVKRLVLFHNDPLHVDSELFEKELFARRIFPRSLCAYDGMELNL